jgi:hypothetical protein
MRDTVPRMKCLRFSLECEIFFFSVFCNFFGKKWIVFFCKILVRFLRDFCIINGPRSKLAAGCSVAGYAMLHRIWIGSLDAWLTREDIENVFNLVSNLLRPIFIFYNVLIYWAVL